MKINFKQFINEDVNNWNTTPMSTSEIIEWCEKNSKKFIKTKTPIYRGTTDIKTGLLDTTKINRKSASTSNHYTLWLDNSDKWNNYPKRSESIIASTSSSDARNFGELYYVIPADSSKVGVCPADDFWYSFDAPIEPPDINDALRKIGIPDGHWEQMISAIRKYKPHTLDTTHALVLDRLMSEYDVGSLEELLDTIYDPIENGFIHTTGAKIPPNRHREVWISGKVIMINSKDFDDELIDYLNFF